MMGYLDRLKDMDSEKCLPSPLQELQKVHSCSFCSTHEARSQETHPEPGGPCRWWLLHFPDREPLEVACFPPSTHAEILSRYPDAVAAEPVHQEKHELALALEAARQDPEGWRRVLEVDDRGGPSNGK